MDVTVVGRNPAGRPGITVHRSRTLDRRDVTKLHDIPVTTAARTLLDFAETAASTASSSAHSAKPRPAPSSLPEDRSAFWSAATDGAERQPIESSTSAHQQLSHSELEELLLALIRAAGLPEPDMNVLVLGRYKVDFLWREHKTIAEADGGGWHASSKRRDNDNRRDSELREAGFTVERFTDHELTYAAHAAVARLTRAIYGLLTARANSQTLNLCALRTP